MITSDKAAVGLSTEDKLKARMLTHIVIDSMHQYFGAKADFPLHEKKIAILALTVLLEALVELKERHEEAEQQQTEQEQAD